MTQEWITVKEVALNNNCPECYSKDHLELTFKQEFIDTNFSKSITKNITTEMHCNKCDTVIYPERWTEDIERVYDYQMKAFEPKKASKKFKLLYWVLTGVVLAVITAISSIVLTKTIL